MRRGSSSGLRERLLRYLRARLEEQEQLLGEYVERLRRRYPRSIVVLFGSRARGSSLPYSDYDVALVLPVEECGDKMGAAMEARRLKPPGISVDLVVLCLDELDDPLVAEMLRGARILYDGTPRNTKGE